MTKFYPLLCFLSTTYAFYGINPLSLQNPVRFALSIIATGLLFVLYEAYGKKKETFTFNVTPWKTTCLNDRGKRSCKCCPAGMNGQGVSFEYTGDAERMDMQVNGECALEKVTPFIRDFDKFTPVEQTIEGYCSPCAASAPPLTEGYCGSCTASAPPLTEGYCAASAPPLTEGYCGSCSGV